MSGRGHDVRISDDRMKTGTDFSIGQATGPDVQGRRVRTAARATFLTPTIFSSLVFEGVANEQQ